VSRFWEKRWYGSGGGGLLEAPLWLVSRGYGAVVAVRSHLVRPKRIEGARVVSVGNLTVGGSGKTPVVIFLAGLAAQAGRRVAVLSRGFGRRSGADVRFDAANLLSWRAVGDEPRLIAQRCPKASVWVGRDRAHLAAAARDAGAELLVLDDGMQHRRLARDVEVVVVDAVAGFGNGQLLPAGPLREPISQLSRATFVWLRQTGPSVAGLEQLLGQVKRVVSRPVAQVLGGTIAGKQVVALAGLARPSAFTRTLMSLGATVVAERYFADHHPFTPGQLDEVRSLGVVIVTTEKDAQRLPPGYPALVVRLEEELVSGRELLAEHLGL
jgi:tetraacyldisaccharide 4'-kinase